MSTGRHVPVPVQDPWVAAEPCVAIPFVAAQWRICKERNCDLMNNGITRKYSALFSGFKGFAAHAGVPATTACGAH